MPPIFFYVLTFMASMFHVCWKLDFWPLSKHSCLDDCGVTWNKFQIPTLILKSKRISSQKLISKFEKLNLALSSWSIMFSQYCYSYFILFQITPSAIPNCPKVYQFTPPWLCSLFCVLPKDLCTLNKKKSIHWKLDKLLYHNRTGCDWYNFGKTHGI